MNTVQEASETSISLKEWIKGEFSHVNQSIESLSSKVSSMEKKLDDKLEEYDKRINTVENRFSSLAVITTTITTAITIIGAFFSNFLGGKKL